MKKFNLNQTFVAVAVSALLASSGAYAADATVTLGNTIADSLNTAGAGATTIGNPTGVSAITGSSTLITGTTNVNTTGVAATKIGTAGGATSIGSAAVGGVAASVNTITGTTGIVGTTAVTGATNVNTTGVAATRIGTAGGATSIGSAAVGGVAASVNTIAGTTAITGATNVNTTGAAATRIGTAGGATLIGGAASRNTITGTTGVVGVTNVNTTGLAATNIGTAGGSTAIGNTASTNTVTGTTGITGITTITGAANVNTTGGGTTNIGTGAVATVTNIGNANAVNTFLGATSINDSISAATNINTGSSAGMVTIGNASNTSSINSGTNNIGMSGNYATANNIGTNNAFSSVNALGNNNISTTVSATAGNTSLVMVNGMAGLRSGIGAASNGFTTTSTAQTLSTAPATLATQLNNVGDASTRQNLAGISFVNRLDGNTLINGNTYVNGSIAYSSNTTAVTTVSSGGSALSNATQATSGQMGIVNPGFNGVVVDANGKMTSGAVGQTTASLTVTNGIGNTHGLVVTEDKLSLSGGTRSTSLVLTEDGATFSNAATGAPAQVHGVADGTRDFDAVNVRQLRSVTGGVSSVAAIANIPQVGLDKTFSLGVGVGTFMGQSSLAVGGSYRFSNSVVIKGSLASSQGSSRNTVVGLGSAWSW